MEDHYATLRVRPTANKQEIERAYRRLVRAHHPDLLRDATPEARRGAEEKLKRINRAHRILGDRERRRAYDRERLQNGVRLAPAARPGAGQASHRRPATERTSHWSAGGPIDIEWTTPPPRAARPETDIFSTRRLVRYGLLIIAFAILLAVLWRPLVNRAAAPTAPTAIATPAP